MRKPIQIAALRYDVPSKVEGQPASFETEVIALCDDGTIWTHLSTTQDWVPLPRIPSGPILEDWIDEVAAMLVEYSFRQDAIPRIIDEQRSFLIQQFNAGSSQGEAAKAIHDRFK